MAGVHGWGLLCACVRAWVGGCVAWVHLSTLLLFDGTQCAFIHYSYHAEGETLGQGFGKSKPELFYRLVCSCGGVCARFNVGISLQKSLISWYCQYQAGHSDTSRKSLSARAQLGNVCACIHMSVYVCPCVFETRTGSFSVSEEGFERALTALVPRRPLFSAVSLQCHENIGVTYGEYISSVFSWRHWDADFI